MRGNAIPRKTHLKLDTFYVSVFDASFTIIRPNFKQANYWDPKLYHLHCFRVEKVNVCLIMCGETYSSLREIVQIDVVRIRHIEFLMRHFVR